MTATLHAVLDLDAPGAAGLAIRRVASPGQATVVVTHKTYSYLKRDCGGSDKRATKWLADLAKESGRPIALNLENGDGSSQTVFLAPPDWSQERLAGFIAGRHAEIEAMFGEVGRMWGRRIAARPEEASERELPRARAGGRYALRDDGHTGTEELMKRSRPAHPRAAKVRTFRSNAEATADLRAMLAEALPITGTGICLQPFPPFAVPVVRVDVRGRPDVADLVRVHRLEGEGEVLSRWIYILDDGELWWVFVDCQVLRPARCRFLLAFEYERRPTLLRAIAETGAVGLAIRGEDPEGVFAFEVPTDDLRYVLARAS